jgi:Phospholipase_D-nuclease N-terminal
MPFAGGLFALAVLGLWIYCIVDVISSDESLVRNLPKLLWLVLVIFLPTVGSIAWLILGRPPNASFVPGDSRPRPGGARTGRRFVPPDDSPEFLSTLDERSRELRQWEEDLKRREDELRKRRENEEPE